MAKRAPGPRGVPWFGSTFDAWKDPLGLMSGAIAEHGNVIELKFGPFRYVVVNEPAAVKHVLVDNPKNYTKSRNYKGLKLILGEGLVTSEGEHWRRQRKLAQPAFHREKLAGFCDTMGEATSEMLERWRADKIESFDAHHEMMRLTFDIVGRTLFSTRLDEQADGLGETIRFGLEFANAQAEALATLPLWVPTPSNVRFRRERARLDALVLEIIADHRRTERDDLLGMLLRAEDEETKEKMSDRQLRDEVMTLVLAGHETTANALTFTFYLLSRHPDVARRMEAEVDRVLDGRATPRLEDLPKLELTRRVIEESMRLYPPVWAFERQAIEPDEVLGFEIPKRAIVGVCPYTLHRHPAYWSNPEGFDPDRFLPEAAAARPRYAYLPFGGGPRTCIGNGFAMMEAQIAVATIARRFRLDLAPGARLELSPVVTLRPKGPVPMTLRARAAGATEASDDQALVRGKSSCLSASTAAVAPTR